MTPALKEKLARLEFVQKLRKFMADKNLSLHDIAQIAGTAPGTVTRWLNLHSAPHTAMMRVLLRKLELERTSKWPED